MILWAKKGSCRGPSRQNWPRGTQARENQTVEMRGVLWPVIAAFCALLLAPLAQARDVVTRMEPSSWWTGFENPGLQLLVYGERAGGLTARVGHPGVRLTSAEAGPNPNYLFLDLEIDADAPPGPVRIDFLRKGKIVQSRVLELHPREPGSAGRRGFGAKDAIYLITPDRFANGNVANDIVKGLSEPADRSKPGGRHGGDIDGVIGALDYISGMGFTQIWLNPVLENNQPEYSYHGYATTDFYKVDPRFGTNADMRRLAEAARTKGMGVIMDMIVNHAGSQHWWLRDPPGPDWINFSGRFSPTNHFHITLMDPYASARDRRQFADGWFVEAMPDLNQRDPRLARYLIQNSIWWIEYAGLSGVRMDTWPYPDKTFMAEWTRRVLQEYPEFTVVGEELSRNPAMLAYWQKGNVNRDGYVSFLPSLMDFPLQDQMRQALVEEDRPGSWNGLVKLYEALATDFIYPDPGNLVVLPDNHDLDRILTQLGGDVDLARMALAYTAVVRGIPQIYYGTEVLFTNPGKKDDGIIRSDFPGGFPGDRANAFTGQGLSAQQKQFQDFVRTLFVWRRDQPVVHSGRLVHFAPDPNDAARNGTYVLARLSDGDGVVLALNKSREIRSLPVADYSEAFRGKTSGRDVITGARIDLSKTLSLPARSVTLIDLD